VVEFMENKCFRQSIFTALPLFAWLRLRGRIWKQYLPEARLLESRK
jgi:hypothetical protein